MFSIGEICLYLQLDIILNLIAMLSEKMQDAINAQINAEYWSAYLYLSMAAYANASGYQVLPIGLKCSIRRNSIM